MRKLAVRKFVGFLVIMVCMATVTNVGLATMSLGWWQEGAPGSTQEYWNFTPDYVTASGSGYSATPEVVNNPYPQNISASISGPTGLSYSSTADEFTDTGYIYVYLVIPNYDITNDYKEIWIDTGTPVKGITVSATDGSSTTFQYTILQPGAGQGADEFGIRIEPNPYQEKIGFYVLPEVSGGEAVLNYVHADTICIPEPATIGLLGLGGLGLIRRKK